MKKIKECLESVEAKKPFIDMSRRLFALFALRLLRIWVCYSCRVKVCQLFQNPDNQDQPAEVSKSQVWDKAGPSKAARTGRDMIGNYMKQTHDLLFDVCSSQ